MTVQKIRVVIPVDLETSKDGIDIWCPNVPGLSAWGKDTSEALRNIDKAFRQYIQHIINHEQPLPKFVVEQISSYIDILVRETSTPQRRKRRTFTEMLDVGVAAVA